MNLDAYGCNLDAKCNSLISRAGNICLNHDISFVKYIIDTKYSSLQPSQLKRCFPVNDNLYDSVRFIEF